VCSNTLGRTRRADGRFGVTSNGLVHEAYACALDLTYAVAASFGVVAVLAVFVFVRPRTRAEQERSLVETAGQTQ
jgi:hypothetical protein